MEDTNCDYCGITAYKKISQIKKNKNNFCSKKCQNNFYKGKCLYDVTKRDNSYLIGENNPAKRLEVRRKISQALKGVKHSKEHKENLRLACLNKKLSEKTKAKISDKMKGRIISLETRIKIAKAKIGKKMSLEACMNMKKNHWSRGCKKEEVIGKITTENMREKLRKRKLEEWKNPNFSNKIVQILRNNRKKQIIPIKDTSIEVKIQNFLKQLGIEFFTHQYIKEIEHGYQCDILIPAMNLVIECDGDYWHKYPIGNELDHIRTKELIEKGFKVLRLWENEIKKITLEEFKNKLEDNKTCSTKQ